MQENLQDMINNLNTKGVPTVVDPEIKNAITEPEIEDPTDVKPEEGAEIKLVNFYDWYLQNEAVVTGVTKITSEVSQVNPKDSMIFKIKKGKGDEMEMVSFYNPSTRPILNLPPVYVKIFKNDTFEVLHYYSDEIFIKSYGVKNGLILMYCANVDGKVVPFEKIKIKKNATGITLQNYEGVAAKIKSQFAEPVDVESIQLLYKQTIKNIGEFTTKEKTMDWFLKKQSEVIDINHLLKIDSVLVSVL